MFLFLTFVIDKYIIYITLKYVFSLHENNMI